MSRQGLDTMYKDIQQRLQMEALGKQVILICLFHEVFDDVILEKKNKEAILSDTTVL